MHATGIVEYLSTSRPLQAYRFYSAGNSNDDRAERLRRTPNLESILPQWLGWTVTPLGESPLTVAVIAKDVEILKRLLELSPKLLNVALHEKFAIFPPFSLSVKLICIPESNSLAITSCF